MGSNLLLTSLRSRLGAKFNLMDSASGMDLLILPPKVHRSPGSNPNLNFFVVIHFIFNDNSLCCHGTPHTKFGDPVKGTKLQSWACDNSVATM